jgi:hypothetical protein
LLKGPGLFGAILSEHSVAAAQPTPPLLPLQVRNGPVDLPLFRKPLDPTLRRTKRLSSRSDGLHLTVRGIE